MKNLNIILLLLFVQFCTKLQAQKIENDSIINQIPYKYFQLDRENFHLQLNKNTFLNNETLWFNAYVFDKKNYLLSQETTNVNVNLLDSDGKVIDKKLFFSEKGTFTGSFKLNKNYQSGFYYLHVFTNWSNNFLEDESALIKFEIINPETGKLTATTSNLNISIVPEGGTFIQNTDAIFGVTISDCLDNGITISNAKLIDESGKEILTFSTNENGYGFFKLVNPENSIYKISFTYNNKEYEKQLPLTDEYGVTLSINNFANNNKVYASIKTNPKTIEKEKEKKYYFTINQNDQINYFKFELDKLNQDFTLPQELFYNGINIIRILSENNTAVNERIIYKPYDSEFDINYSVVKKSKDSITIAATLLNNARLGISVLPEKTKCISKNQTIFNSLLLSSYLKKPYTGKEDLFGESTRKKRFEIDLLFLCQGNSKYNWNDMKNTPSTKYSFNKGVTLKGTINSTLIEKDKTIEMYSFNDNINVKTTVNDKNEFYFKNFISIDSANVNFVLRNKNQEKVAFNYYPQILSDEKPFNKSINYFQNVCDVVADKKLVYEKENFPKFKNGTLLNEVIVKTIPKIKASENKSKYGNEQMTSYKIGDSEYKTYRFVLPFLSRNGFDTRSQFGAVSITSRMRTSMSRVLSPAVFLDDVRLFEFDLLDNFSMDQVDEIFIDKNGMSPQSEGGGVIKIYTKKDYKSKRFKDLAKSFTITNGFAKTVKYINPIYDDTNIEAFSNYGTIYWTTTDETNNKLTQFTIPNLGQKKITLFTEGVSEDGKMISQIKILDLE